MIEPTNIAYPHDILFKAFLSTKDTARDFFEIHLPKSLQQYCNFSTLKLEPTSFVDKNLRHYMSDVLYSCQTKEGDGYIYCLVEHQSKKDKMMAFRLLKYALAAMQLHLDAGHKTLPIVIPILFSQTEESPYPYSTDWIDCFDDKELARTIYSTPFPLVDLTVISDDDIMNHKRIAVLELLQKHIRQRDILEFIDLFISLLTNTEITGMQTHSALEYLLRVGQTTDLNKVIDSIVNTMPEEGRTIMRIAEQLRQQGLERGRQEGLQEGEQRGGQRRELEIAKELLLAGIDKSVISKTTGLTLDELALLTN